MSKEIVLSNDYIVSKNNYVMLKTKDLIEFGYSDLKEQEVLEEVEKILNDSKELSVIGMFCKDDINVEKSKEL